MDDLSHLLHRLRNSLNTISINAELLKLLAEERADADAIDTCVARILAECRQCTALLNGDDKNPVGNHPVPKRR